MLIAAQIIGGLLLLVGGGEALVRGAVSLAKTLSIPTIVIGLTVVSFGTSAPELVVSIHASLTGHPDIAIGNVLGSNIANILLVLGPTAIIYPIVCKPELIRRELLLMLIVSAVLVVFCLDGEIQRYEGILFLIVLVLYYYDLYRNAKDPGDPELEHEIDEEIDANLPLLKALPLSLAAVAMLVLGADLLVEGASEFARILGISEGVIALTVIALGTSAPELVTSIVAAYHKHNDIAIGNVIGSNLFNMFGVIGVAATILPIPVSEQFRNFDIWVMMLVALILLPVMRTGFKIDRMEGGLFLLAYVGYTYYQYHSLIG